jgi:hypothetical protein
MHPPPSPLDAGEMFSIPLTWTVDHEFPWLRADFGGQTVFLRLNTSFPDTPAYSLLVDEDVTVDFDDLPPKWTRGPLSWPEADAP